MIIIPLTFIVFEMSLILGVVKMFMLLLLLLLFVFVVHYANCYVVLSNIYCLLL